MMSVRDVTALMEAQKEVAQANLGFFLWQAFKLILPILLKLLPLILLKAEARGALLAPDASDMAKKAS